MRATMLQGDRGHERSHMRKAGKSRWSHMLQGDTIAGGELHYCGAGASKAGKLLRQTLGRDRKRCVTCATCCEAVVQLPRAEPADARGCGLSNQPGCRQSRVHRTAWTMESRSRFLAYISVRHRKWSRGVCAFSSTVSVRPGVWSRGVDWARATSCAVRLDRWSRGVCLRPGLSSTTSPSFTLTLCCWGCDAERSTDWAARHVHILVRRAGHKILAWSRSTG